MNADASVWTETQASFDDRHQTSDKDADV